MQKVYSRIRWENSPSANTPLGENNLNAMDYALDEIDNRVISLSGYQDRVAESENNAKKSELNAKQSELLAKEYKDKAFTYTPDGYEEMLDEVFGLDIKSSTKSPLLNTRNGGLRFNSIRGKSEQNTEPTPSNPIAILNAFDCVEMMQGAYSTSNGAYATNTSIICNKNPIPCNSGEVVNITTEKSLNTIVFFYNDNGYVSSTHIGSGVTIPSGVTKFNFRIEDTTVDTVGKITLSINGQYVALVKTVGKNFAKLSSEGTSWAYTENGIKNLAKNSGVEFIRANLIGGKTYAISMEVIKPPTASVTFSSSLNGVTYGGLNFGEIQNLTTRRTILHTPTEDTILSYIMWGNANSDTFEITFQIEESTVATEFEPYKETVARVLLNEPLRGIGDAKDEIVNQNGVWGVLRRFAEETFDGSADERARFSYSLIGDGVSYRWVISAPNAKIFTDGYKTANILSSRYAPIPSNSLLAGMQGISVAASSRNLLIFSDELNDNDVTTVIESFSENPLTVVYELATPTFEELDADSQIALNGLETFDGATTIVFDSIVKPTFEVEYGESKVGAYTLKALNTSESNAVKLNELQVALVSIGSEV